MEKKGMERREFLFKSSLGIATAGLALPLTQSIAQEEKKSPTLIYRTLGRTGLSIPVVSFGVMNSDSPDLMKRALEKGVKHLDTAFGYLNGNSEKTIGSVVKEMGLRDQVFIASKVWLARDRDKHVYTPEDIGRMPGATLKNFNDQLELSLERLQTDYVDIYYLHACASKEMVNYEPMMESLLQAKKAGKARFVGVSTHTNVAEVIRAAVDAKIYDVLAVAFNFWRNDKDEVGEAIEYAHSHGVGIIAMKTQGGRRRDANIAVNHTAALKWVLSHEGVSTTIPGMTTFDQLDLNFSVMANLELDEQEKKDLKLSALDVGSLCRSCRRCIPTCPHRVEIPNLMRAHMYADAYGNLSQAEWTLHSLPEKQGLQACRSCSVCSATCVQGLKIGRNVQSLKRQFVLLA
ncbi:aldo/keto reductase [candidate division KSB1 bacterium]|nr:aldo/keto reductase [candidate division KSB1 bacterium]